VPTSHPHLRPIALAVALLALLHAAAALAEIVFPRGELVVETAGGSHRFRIELALTPEQQRHGLMFRTAMPEDHGMLFDFRLERPVSMWMRNTFIPLDMVFIRGDGTIHHVAALGRLDPLRGPGPRRAGAQRRHRRPPRPRPRRPGPAPDLRDPLTGPPVSPVSPPVRMEVSRAGAGAGMAV
jgi:uncharacterized protein